MWINHLNPFGLAPIKREGQKYCPLGFLEQRGHWPSRDFYTDEEYKQHQQDGWEYCQDEAKHEKA